MNHYLMGEDYARALRIGALHRDGRITDRQYGLMIVFSSVPQVWLQADVDTCISDAARRF